MEAYCSGVVSGVAGFGGGFGESFGGEDLGEGGLFLAASGAFAAPDAGDDFDGLASLGELAELGARDASASA